jgi:protocatechuate 3,4-dioxygenase, alpha subunit
VSGLTPYQTVGPFFDFGLCVPGAEVIASENPDAHRITIEGTVFDGAGQIVCDALIEIWHADAGGRYPGGFGRCGTDDRGRFAFTTIVPGRVAYRDGLQAPHLVVGVLGRGVMTRLITRIYFDDQPANADDPILLHVPANRRATLIARRTGEDRYEFNVRLQGEHETVFFDV